MSHAALPNGPIGILLNALNVGGAERLVVDLLGAWRTWPGAAFHVFLLSAGGPLEAAVRRLDWPLASLSTAGWADPRLPSRLAAAIRREGIGILHSHLPRSGAIGGLAARLAGVPSVYTEHNVWTSYRRPMRAVHRRALPLHARIVAVSDAVRTSLAIGFPRLASRTLTIVNGVPLDALSTAADARMATRTGLGLGPGDRLVLNVANLRREKNQALLVEAFAALPASTRASTRLLIVGGDGGERATLQTLVRRLGLDDRIELTGSRDDATRLIAAADLFVLSSNVEGLPLALLEACALERAAVATAVGGVPEVLEDDDTGWLVPPGNASALTARLATALADPTARERVGRRARQRVEERFSLAGTAAAYAQLYRDLARGEPATETARR